MKLKLFISYAHVDDEPMGKDSTGWVSEFVRNLRMRLAHELGRREYFEIWMDSQLGPADPVNETIRHELDESHVLLLFASNGYLHSEWCQGELLGFLNERQDKFHGRCFRVDVTRLNGLLFPSALQNNTGAQFWREASDGDSVLTLGDPGPAPHGDPYWEAFFRFANKLAQKLREIAKIIGTPIPDKVLPSSSHLNTTAEKRTGFSMKVDTHVFMAEVSELVEDDRQRVRDFLQSQLGCIILSPDEYPRQSEQYQARLKADLSKCSIFVQMLGEHPGKKAHDKAIYYSQIQFEMAVSAGIQIYRWLDPKVKLDEIAKINQVYAKFLQDGELHQAGLPRFISVLRNNVGSPSIDKSSPPKVPFVFLNRIPKDDHIAEHVAKILEEEGQIVWHPARAREPDIPLTSEEMLTDLSDNLRSCDALVLISGNSPRVWIDEQFRQARKIRPRFNDELHATGLVLAPPPKSGVIRITGRKLIVVDCEELDFHSHSTFIAGLKPALEELLTILRNP